MNLSIYVFKRYRASVGNKVLSFPTDLDKTIEEIVDSIDFPYRQRIKLIVLRQGNLVHYLYVVKIDADLVGFVFTMNGAYLADVGSLCRACTDIIAAISSQSLIITWSGRNGLAFTTKNVAAYREEAEKVMVRLEELRDNSVFSKAGALPPLDYSEAKQSKRLDWSCKSIIEPIPEEYRHIDRLEIILPAVNYSVSAVLAEANKVADTWKKHYSELSTRFNTLNRQKKRMKWVVILALCLIAGGIILLNVNKNLNHTQSSLTEANNRIKSLTANIDSLTANIDSVNVVNNIYLNDIDTLKKYYGNASSLISRYEAKTPVMVSDMVLKYWDGYNWISGIPSANKTTYIMFEITYTYNKLKVLNLDCFPSNRQQKESDKNEVVFDSRNLASFEFALRCYYSRDGRSTNITYKMSNAENPFTRDLRRSGTFDTPKFDMGFNRMPAGYYRIEIWDSNNMVCLGYNIFAI